jgi:hypothetical protein
MLFYFTILLILQKRRKGFLSSTCVFSSGKIQYTLLYHKRNVSCNRCCNAHGAAVGSHTVRYVNIWQTQQIKQQRVFTILCWPNHAFSLHPEWHSVVCAFFYSIYLIDHFIQGTVNIITPFPTDLGVFLFIYQNHVQQLLNSWAATLKETVQDSLVKNVLWSKCIQTSNEGCFRTCKLWFNSINVIIKAYPTKKLLDCSVLDSPFK